MNAAKGRRAGWRVDAVGLFLAAALALSGCTPAQTPQQTATPPAVAPVPAPLRATVVPPEVELFEGRLFATVWLNRSAAAADGTVEMRLTGQGAPDEVVRFPEGRSSCPGIDYDFGVEEGSWTLARDRACSWDAARLAPGRYGIEVTAAGRRIGAYSFDLVEVPASGAELTLAVSPESRTNIAYVHPKGLAYWLAIDARYESRPVSFVFFQNGQLAGARRVMVEGPRLRGGGAPVSMVRPVLVRNPPSGQASWHLAAFVDEEMIGSWHYSWGDDHRWHGIQIIRGQGFGPIEAGPLPDVLLGVAVEQVRGQRSTVRHERRVCAVASLPEAVELVASMSAGSAAPPVVDPTAPPGASPVVPPEVRWDDAAVVVRSDASRRYGPTAAEALRRLDRLAARFDTGCMDTVLAPPPAPEAPAAPEAAAPPPP